MKKFLILMLSSVLLLGFFSGCGGNGIRKDGKIPSFDNLVDLKDYFLKSMSEDNFAPEFCYTGKEVLEPSNLCRMACVAYCSIEYDENNPHFRRAVLTEYPGDRMIKAHNSGDMSILNDEEKEALEKAVKIVEELKAASESEPVLELKIHNWLCDNITYDDSTRSVFNPKKIPPNLTAVGALINGSANCQGYSDAFCVLATLAGFTVDRQYCRDVNNGDLHVINNIKLNDKWYIVDVTYDDNSIRLENEIRWDCHLLNVGMDIANQEYTWPAEYEHHPIEKKTAENYFYFTEENEKYPYFGQAFTDIDDMAKEVIRQWSEQGRTMFFTMLKGSNAEWTALRDALIRELNALDDDTKFYVTSVGKGKNSFFTIEMNVQ